MKFLATSFLVFALIAATFATPIPTPAFAWSSASSQLQGPNYELNSLSVSDLLERTTKFEQKPELVVIFMTNNMPEVSEATLPSLHRILKSSPSSLTIPYVYGNELVESVENFGAAADGEFLVSGKQTVIKGATVTSFKDLRATLKQKQVFSNNKLDVVVVLLKKDRIDTVIAKFSEFLSTTKKDFVCVFTAEQQDKQMQMEFPRERIVKATRSLTRKHHEEEEPDQYTTRWPVGVIQGIAFMAIFIFTIAIGTIATMNIQVPTKFEGGEKK